MVEEWRAVVGYEGLYEVSNTGKIRSVTHMIHVNWDGHEYDRVVRGKQDENRWNNNVDNLEWCTASYNNNYNNGQKRRAITRKLNRR